MSLPWDDDPRLSGSVNSERVVTTGWLELDDSEAPGELTEQAPPLPLGPGLIAYWDYQACSWSNRISVHWDIESASWVA